ncbi:MAG: protein kinase [bacterium]|nr:protein kinase [bacterium]
MIGQKVKEHYEIQELIGRGAMGTIYRAYDEALDREVAIKFLSTDATPTHTDVERFYREARAAAGLVHPNVVTIHDIGEHDGAYFFVMELLPGASLREWLKERHQTDWREGLEMSAQICRGLEVAHEKGLLHRDIKPDNVWVHPDGRIKLLDFGIARFSAAHTLTQAGETMGTPEFMAPEQIMGDQLDGRTDLYSVGILMYELFTGQLPFTGPNPVTVIYKHMEEEPTPPGQWAKELPVAVEKIILRAMGKSPDERWASATEMREAIEALLEGREEEAEEEAEAPDVLPGPEALAPEEEGVRFDCPLVGREAELKTLKAVVDGLDQERGETVLVGGEAGIGKTRLSWEAMTYARQKGALLLQGSCLYSEGPEPYRPFIEALGQGLDVQDEAGRGEVMAFIRREAPELEGLASQLMTAVRTQRFTIQMSPQEEVAVASSKERLFEAVMQVLLFLSRTGPVVLFLDDLQWADSGSLQMLHYLARSAREHRLLILGTYRTEDLLPDADGVSHPLVDTMQRMSREAVFERITLEGLGAGDMRQMVRAIFPRSRFSGDFMGSLYRETGGNPFFVIEVLQLLRDEEVIFERRGVWREKREITHGDLPDRVYDVVARRIERLAEDQRELLQGAAVAGEYFTAEALSSIMEEGRVGVLKSLNRLERAHRLVRSVGEAYAFTHAKIREVLYEEITPGLRREYHLAYGTYLQKEETGKKHTSDLAMHFFQGHAFDKALPYLVQAAERAEYLFAFREARDYYRWALEAMSESGIEANRPTVLYKLGHTYDRLGDSSAALSHLEEAEKLAGQGRNDRMSARIQQQIGALHFRGGDFDLATERYRKSIENYRKAGDQAALGEVLVQAANIPFEQGNWSRVQSYYSRALRIARQAKAQRQIATILMNSGIMAAIRGEPDRALEYFKQSRPIYETLKDWSHLAKLWINEGKLRADQGVWDQAQAAYEKGLAIVTKTHNIFQEAECHLNLAEVFLATSDLRESKRACLKALEIFQKVNDQLWMADVFKTLGQVAKVERKWDEARSFFKKSIEVYDTLKNPYYAGSAHLEFARMLKEEGDLEAAAEEADRSMTFFLEVDARDDAKIAEDLKGEAEALRDVALA